MYGSSRYRGTPLQHYSGNTRTTEIQVCLWVHQQVCCAKMSSIKSEMN